MLKLAWRNLWRNRTRTVITATAIAVTYALYLISNGVQDWSFDQMRQAASKAAGGDVLVQATGYLDDPQNDRFIASGDGLLEKLRKLDGVSDAAPRVLVNGLVSTSASSLPTTIRGIEPSAEAKLQDMERYLVEGTWFGGKVDAPLILGRAIAEELDAEIGDRVIVTAMDHEGEMRRALFHLEGVLATGSSATDRALAFTTIGAARKAIGLDAGLTQIGVIGPNRVELARTIGEMTDREEVEALPWDVAMPELIGFIEMKKNGGVFMGFLLFFVVLFSIINTFLMIVMERVREFGLVGALGLTPGATARMLLAETSLLAVVAMAIGLAMAFGVHTWISVAGIDVAALYGDSMEVAGVSLTDTVIRSRIDPLRWIGASIAVFLMVLFAAAYPAYKAMRLAPAEAMRFYE